MNSRTAEEGPTERKTALPTEYAGGGTAATRAPRGAGGETALLGTSLRIETVFPRTAEMDIADRRC